MNPPFLLLLSSLAAVCGQSFADDWPQFRGPQRDGVSRETNLLKSFGDEVWSAKALEKGTVTIADGMMYCLTEDSGTVVLAETSPKGWKEISRFMLAPQSERRALKAKVWTPPVIAHGHLYLRDHEKLWCLNLHAAETPSASSGPHKR